MSKDLTKQQKEEVEKLQKEIVDEAKKDVEDDVDNPTDISGSVVSIHKTSTFLGSDEKDEPMYSGSRWTKVISSKM